MRLNSNVNIIGQNIILVPYEKHHVPKYHNWMKSKELQSLTASEPLSLEQEYEMQVSWREDEDKCTFIILNKETYNQWHDEIESMIGDINIFITDKMTATGEIEIMIAETLARGKKFGWEATILMLLYGIKHIHLNAFEAKILVTNNISIRLFEKLGFTKKSESKVFQEVTLEKKVNDDWISWLEEQFKYTIKS